MRSSNDDDGAIVVGHLACVALRLRFNGAVFALVLMASIRERVELSDVPALARGVGLVLILAGSLSLAFMGFAGLFSQ